MNYFGNIFLRHLWSSRCSSRLKMSGVGALALLAVLSAAPSQAATSTTLFTVNANVLAVCSATATNIEFGDYDATSGTPNDTTSTISATCTNGQPYTVSLDAGISSGAAVNARAMTNAGHLLNYALYTTSGHTTIWGDGTLSTATVAGTGNGSAQPLTVYGRVPTGQHVADGSYSDTITVTLTY